MTIKRLSPAPRLAFVLAASLQLLAASCQEAGPFGMTEEAFRTAISTKDQAAILALKPSDLDKPGPGGAPVYYYTARWLDTLIPAGSASRKGETPAAAGALPGLGEDAGAPEAAGSDLALPDNGRGALPSSLPSALEDLGSLRPEGRASGASAASLGPRRRVRELYRLAFERNEGFMKRAAGLAWTAALGADARAAAAAGDPAAGGLWNEALDAAQDFGSSFGPERSARLLKLEALEALGRDAELFRECADFRAGFPDSAADDDALLYYEAVSSQRLGKVSWAIPLRRLIFEKPVSAWTRKASDFLGSLDPEAPEFSQAELSLLRMRLAIADRDYGLAYRSALGARSLVLSEKASRETVTELGKAWLYSGESKEGLELFASIWGDYPGDAKSIARTEPEAASAWAASFYRARFLRALDSDAEARKLFLALAASAPSDKDCDAALWYALDSGIEAKKASQAARAKALGRRAPSEARREAELRRSSLGLLYEASGMWKDPASFDDAAEGLLLDALAAQDWALIFDMASSLAPRLSPAIGSKLSYIAGRSLELGLYSPFGGGSTARGLKPPANPASLAAPAADFYRAALAREGGSLYYRLLAGRRLGTPPPILPASGVTGVAGAIVPRLPAAPSDAEKFIIGFIDFGLPDLAFAELRSLPDSGRLGPEGMRRAAEAFARAGDCASSMRTILDMFASPGWSAGMATRRDYELLYPRPFLDELRSQRPRRDVPEYVFYGLLRSESYFRPSIASEAGAVGLAQIMPSTAKELARGLGIKDYDLKRPADSLRLGSSYFAELLSENGARPLEAMFAYNAGRGRLRRWLGSGEGLPDDLLLETLDIEETRQYGRNILQASVFYGELYYGMSAIDAIDGVLAEKDPN